MIIVCTRMEALMGTITERDRAYFTATVLLFQIQILEKVSLRLVMFCQENLRELNKPEAFLLKHLLLRTEMQNRPKLVSHESKAAQQNGCWDLGFSTAAIVAGNLAGLCG
jgi:hypothetical protein